MNIFYKSASAVIKVLALSVCAYLFVGLFFATNNYQLAIGFFVLIFITLPTIFVIFFKKSFLKKHSKFLIFWKIYRIFYVIFIILYAGLWIIGTWRLNQQAETQKAVDFINSQKITLNDVLGKNLPPVPDQKLNDSTIAGIDENHNEIRDDVELAIFKKYPNSAKIRAAELQYAQALQLELTQVFNSEMLVASIRGENLASFCIGGAVKIEDAMSKESEVDNLVDNTESRMNKHKDIFEKFMTGYALPSGNGCDIDISSLPN